MIGIAAITPDTIQLPRGYAPSKSNNSTHESERPFEQFLKQVQSVDAEKCQEELTEQLPSTENSQLTSEVTSEGLILNTISALEPEDPSVEGQDIEETQCSSREIEPVQTHPLETQTLTTAEIPKLPADNNPANVVKTNTESPNAKSQVNSVENDRVTTNKIEIMASADSANTKAGEAPYPLGESGVSVHRTSDGAEKLKLSPQNQSSQLSESTKTIREATVLSNVETGTNDALDSNFTPEKSETTITPTYGATERNSNQNGQLLPNATMNLKTVQFHQTFGSHEWQSDFSNQIVSMAVKGDSQIVMHLNPKGLGSLLVDIQFVSDEAHIKFVSSHAQVRSTVEQALPQLRESLGTQGISLGETSVSSQGNQGFNQSPRNQKESKFSDPVAPNIDSASSSTPTQVVMIDGAVNLYI